jgi:hypothetical protein
MVKAVPLTVEVRLAMPRLDEFLRMVVGGCL